MSIYEYICDHLTPSGTLPADFKLPGRTPAAESSSHSALSDMQLVDGALDGIALFHGPSEEADCAPLADLMSATSMGDTGASRRPSRRISRRPRATACFRSKPRCFSG